MKILLVHPADDPEIGPWASQRWARIIDLGLGGGESYQRWERRFDCQVVPVAGLRNRFEEIHRVRELLSLGRGRLTDFEDLDWWELTAIFFHQEMESLVLLQRLAQTFGPNDQVHVTRPGFYGEVLRVMLRNRLHVFAAGSTGQPQGPRRYLRLASKFPPSQLIQIFWDKYDAGYQIRGHFTRARSICENRVVLLPSAYVNVSRTAIAYAKTVPDKDFLLVATRRSAWMESLPTNVSAAWLSSYASLDTVGTKREYSEMVNAWQGLRRELEAVLEIRMMGSLGLLDDFPKRFRQGLQIREAWRQVFAREPIQAVLCADDSNPYTHIPLLLAKKRALPAIACHHGALDGRYMIKQNHADVILAKGSMEQDYLVRRCGVPPAKVEVGAPHSSTGNRSGKAQADAQRFIVFFSEVYEVSGGRAEEFYRDILAPLADLAIQTGNKLVVKLHPSESHRERSGMVARLLSPAGQRVTTVVSGALTQELLEKTWFGITVLSTVAMECALLGIPCFLCEWLEAWPYGYVEQFTRFGVGYGLKSPREIVQIPEILESYSVRRDVADDVWQAIAPERLEELLSADKTHPTAAAGRMRVRQAI